MSAERLGVATVKAAVDAVLREVRAGAARSRNAARDLPAFEVLAARVRARLAHEEADDLVAVLNGTGVLLHTNLGRAPLAAAALRAICEVAAGYSNLEFDVESGARGSRYARVTGLLRATTGAADALVVNNCAAAVLLILDTFAKGREVVVARGELVEIGGGFRLPDVLARSGATLVEVGATNKTYLRDFERALTCDTGLLLRTHASNFRIEGFVASVAAADLARLGARTGVPTVEDLGSGALVDVARYGLPHERTVSEALADGIDLVAFSGDKLLGGPQAGIVAGSASAVARLRANPLLRALRVDKATLAALSATLRLYVCPGGLHEIPLYRMLATPLDELRERAEGLAARCRCDARNVRAIVLQAYVGGGSAPLAALPSYGLAVTTAHTARANAARLRAGRPCLVARIADDAVIVDLRTIAPEADDAVAAALAALD